MRAAETHPSRVATDAAAGKFVLLREWYCCGMSVPLNVLLCWESIETNSWNPVLADLLRDAGLAVTEAHDLSTLGSLDLSDFDVCLPRFRVGAAHMACLDEALVASGIPMLNSRESRRRCENKALAHLAFEEHGIAQPPSFVWSADGARDRHLDWQGETLLKPLYGNRSGGIEICGSLSEALERAGERQEDLLIQKMIWPARCWRIVVGRTSGVVDPYWRRPPGESDRVLSISTGSQIVRDGYSERLGEVATAMLEAVGGDLLAVDILETESEVYALEINHNFDAHGGDAPAAEAFLLEIQRKAPSAVA
ncbi:MAG: [lysine-biosynthesis-protein LysW]---L-2-aminoadipate ligase [Gaiellales bacterium]|nr:[lysine-biosynthesis-protein LysW]---L-2-aminoadipate ligase [Gaiellales bacterium]